MAVILIAVAMTPLAPRARAGAFPAPQRIPEPLHYGDQLFSCPDPDVFKLPGQERWVASCTSDYGQQNPIPGGFGYERSPAAFPIYETTGPSFRTWRFRQFVFPPGHFPWAAIPPLGNWPGGRYWGDEIHHIGRNWVVYFGAEINVQRFHELYPGRSPGGDFGLFVAWTRNLFGGDWHSRLLHYRGQFNGVPGDDREIGGGVIDPSVARDPQTGQLEIVWAKQPNLIFEGLLTANGLVMRDRVHLAMEASRPWMCHPDAGGRHCVIEGPVLAADPVHHGVMDLFANARGTWDGSYRTAVAVSVDPEHFKWTLWPRPLEVSNVGYGLQGPGIGAQPFRSPDGSWLMAVHLLTQDTHYSQHRYLGFVQVQYTDRLNPLFVPASMAYDGIAADARALRGQRLVVPVPAINGLRGTGRPQRIVSYLR